MIRVVALLTCLFCGSLALAYPVPKTEKKTETPSIEILIDREKVGKLGITVFDFWNAINDAMEKHKLTDLKGLSDLKLLINGNTYRLGDYATVQIKPADGADK